ncbi:MAG: putative quinol monooxygenase [Pseudomonadota bacterium]
MILISGSLHIAAEQQDGILDAVATMVAASREEPGCIDYAFSRDLVDPGIVRITERWQDVDALKAHFAMPHMATFQAALGSVEITDREIFYMSGEQGAFEELMG